MSNIGVLQQGQLVPGRPQPARKLCVDVDDTATIGFRADGRLVVLHASRTASEIRDYRSDGRPKVLTTLGGARRIGCEDIGGRLVFFVDGQVVFECPCGRDQFTLYNAAENPSE